MLKELMKIANNLDSLGEFLDADDIDNKIKQIIAMKSSDKFIKSACIIASDTVDGDKILFKNRDRNYKPEIIMYHELINGVEILYLKDELTGWCEGLNEFGIGIVNAALAVAHDEDEKGAAKGKGKLDGATLRDGERMLAALQCNNIEDATKVIQTFKKGLRGHTLISDKERTIGLEATWRGHDFYQSDLSSNKINVRTNHGIHYTDAGYTAKDGDNYLSSLARRDQAIKALKGVKRVEDIAPAIYAKRREDKKDPLNMVKNTDGMRTTTQMVIDLTKLTMILYLIPGQVEYKGYEDKTPKNHEKKLKLQIFKYTDIDSDNEFDVIKKDEAGKRT